MSLEIEKLKIFKSIFNLKINVMHIFIFTIFYVYRKILNGIINNIIDIFIENPIKYLLNPLKF